MRSDSHKEQQSPGSSTLPVEDRLIESQSRYTPGNNAWRWIALALCTAVVASGVVEQIVRNKTVHDGAFTPDWILLAAAGFSAAGIVRLNDSYRWLRIQRVLCWCGVLLMVWKANGLLFDLLRIAGLVPTGIDWPGLMTRTLALTTTVVLVRFTLANPINSINPASNRTAKWYGYAAFVLAMPYPVLRTIWAMGGTLGLEQPGAAGHGWLPWLACIPWLLAATLSLLLVSKKSWMPRRLLLFAGWFATAIVATIGPAACWSMVSKLISGDNLELIGIAIWVPCLFYGSWLLWALAAGAATYSYQLRTSNRLI